MRNVLIFFVIICLFSSCTFDKRLYRDGFYVRQRSHTSYVADRTNIPAENRFNTIEPDTTGTLAAETLDSVYTAGVKALDSAARVSEFYAPADFVPRDTLPPAKQRRPNFWNKEPKENYEWRNAGWAIYFSIVGVILLFVAAELLGGGAVVTLAYLGLFDAVILFFIFLSIRAHWRYVNKRKAEGGKAASNLLGRIVLYAIAIVFASIMNLFGLLLAMA